MSIEMGTSPRPDTNNNYNYVYYICMIYVCIIMYVYYNYNCVIFLNYRVIWVLITQESFDSQIAEQEFSILGHNVVHSHPWLNIRTETFKRMLFTSKRLTWLFRAKNVSPPLGRTRDPFTMKLKYVIRNCNFLYASCSLCFGCTA